ncbi:MAG: FAD-binding protein [Synergistales bacterium]|nr:FAD-binding protein [Synergistales bacterium]
MTARGFNPVTSQTEEELGRLIGAHNVATDREKLRSYSLDEVEPTVWTEDYCADLLVFPESAEHVAAILRYASEHRIPVTPRGAGTGLSGGAVPRYGGIVLSFEKMNRILEVDRENLTVTAEPGVVTAEITAAAAREGLLYAGDPCSGDASYIGGNVAENAGGNKVIKYGATGANVLGLEAVLPDGSVTWFGGKRRKDVTGYDFVHLLVGSEGTLAVVTKVILKLLPLPRHTVDLLVPFADIRSAMAFAPQIMTEGRVLPSSIEFIDGRSLRITEDYLNTPIPYSEAGAHLIIQLEGNDSESLADEYERIGDLCLAQGALEVYVADNKNTRDKLWKTRKSVPEAVWAIRPKDNLNEDLVVPSSRIPELMAAIEEVTAAHGQSFVSYGHVGDGNIHITVFDTEQHAGWKERLAATRTELYGITRELGGTLTGEHGVGLKRSGALPFFLDGAQIDLIRRVKAAFDPQGILNPGKIAPED